MTVLTSHPVQATSPPKPRLLAVLGVVFGVAVTVGNMIGSGILRTPGDVAAWLPSTWLFLGAWVAGGIYALLGANALAELAGITAESGGYTVFVRRGLGAFPGFAVGWTDWLSTCTSMATAALVIGESVAVLSPVASVNAVAGGVIVAFGVIQLIGVRVARAAQELTSAIKALAFAALIAACFVLPGVGSAPPVREVAAVAPGVGILLAMQAIIFTYDGFSGVTYFAGELRDRRDIARSVFGGVLSVIVIYLLVNIAFLHVLPRERLAGSPLAAGDVGAVLLGARGEIVLRVLIILSLLSFINACELIASRIVYGIGSSGLLPAAARVSRSGTPTVGVAVSTLATLVFAVSGTVNTVIAVTAFFFVVNYTLSFLSLFALRQREPDAARPFRAIGHPWTTLIVLGGSAAFLVASAVADRRNTAYSLLMLVLSYPVYRILNLRKRSEDGNPAA